MPSLIPRSQEFDYVRLEGLQKLTNVTAHDWDLYILKELIDNALDADEAISERETTPKIAVVVTYDRQHDGAGLRIRVRNKACFPLDSIDQLFDLTKRVSVKDYYNLPTRGAQGNALKTILGIPFALQYFYFANYAVDSTPLSITYGEKRVELWFNFNELKQGIELQKEDLTDPDEAIDETTITVNLSRFIQKKPRTMDELMRFAQAFSLFNPHADFSFQFIFIERDGQYVVKEHQSPAYSVLQHKYSLSQPAPLNWYGYPEFRELLHALIARAQAASEPIPTLRAVGAEFGIQTLPTNGEFRETSSLAAFLRENSLDPGRTRQLYEVLLDEASKYPEPDLGEIGADQVRTRCGIPDQDSEAGSKVYFFYRQKRSSGTKRLSEPFVLEAALASNRDAKRQVIVGINHTPTYQDPFFNKPLLPPTAEEPQRSLEKVLEFYKLADTEPVTLVIHLIAPNVQYENYGKSAISDEPYRDALVQVIHEVVQEYLEAKKEPPPVDYLSEPAQLLLDQAIDTLGEAHFNKSQLLFMLKRLLRAQGDDAISEDLATLTADTRLGAVIDAHHAAKPIKRLFERPSGRLAVPRHPQDTINVFFSGAAITKIMDQFQSRAIVVTNRVDLEELLIALQFPLLFDLAILRADTNLRGAVELLANRLHLTFSDTDGAESYRLPQIWIVRDATLEAAQWAREVQNIFSEHRIPETAIIDFGLHPAEAETTNAWIEMATKPQSADLQQLRNIGFAESELEFYVTRGCSARLDSLPSFTLISWFESCLAKLGIGVKALPDADYLMGLMLEALRDSFRHTVAKVAFEQYNLEDIQRALVERWRSESPNWGSQFHKSLSSALQNNRNESWQRLLEDTLDGLIASYKSPERLAEIRQMLSTDRTTP